MAYQRELTRRQQEILDFVRADIHRRGYPPSVREIGDAVGLSSSSTVHSHLAALESKGYLRRHPSKPRALEVLEFRDPNLAVDYGQVRAVPLVGLVAAEAGIFNGDFVVVRQQGTASDGDIVVAMIDDEATVKTFYREADRIRLQPQNPTMEPIYSRDVTVLGKVVALFRRL